MQIITKLLYISLLVQVVFIPIAPANNTYLALHTEHMGEKYRDLININSKITPQVIANDDSVSSGGGSFKQTVYDRFWNQGDLSNVGEEIQSLDETVKLWKQRTIELLDMFRDNEALTSALQGNLEMCNNFKLTISTILSNINTPEMLKYHIVFVTKLEKEGIPDKPLTIKTTAKVQELKGIMIDLTVSDPDNIVKTKLRQEGGILKAERFNSNNTINYLIRKHGVKYFVVHPDTDTEVIELRSIGFKNEEYVPCPE